MPDPATTSAIVKAITVAGDEQRQSEIEKNISGLVIRMLGPAADEVGEALRRYAALRLRNVGRIMRKASAKTGGADRGIANPRVAQVVLEQGSYCDDELMAEYLGGVLAGGCTPSGRDDRAVTWSSLITSMSSFQVRAHFVIYREWAARLSGALGLNLGLPDERHRATMDIDESEFGKVLALGSDVDPARAVAHAVQGLVRVGLLDRQYALARFEIFKHLSTEPSPFEDTVRVMPSVVGIELYGWAQGIPDLYATDFTNRTDEFEVNEIPRLGRVSLPFLLPSGP